MLIYRAATRRCEEVRTQGMWLGIMADISTPTVDHTLQLNDGDIMVLYTDGVTEAMNEATEQFGLTRLAQVVERNGERDSREILDAVLSEVRGWMHVQHDDITALVLRYGADG
jgi:sigma-B regulation protein RsbU (phosphoserine phosphatase)